MTVNEAIEVLEPHFNYFTRDDSCLGIALTKAWYRLRHIRWLSPDVVDAQTLMVNDAVEKAITTYVTYRHGGKAQ